MHTICRIPIEFCQALDIRRSFDFQQRPKVCGCIRKAPWLTRAGDLFTSQFQSLSRSLKELLIQGTMQSRTFCADRAPTPFLNARMHPSVALTEVQQTMSHPPPQRPPLRRPKQRLEPDEKAQTSAAPAVAAIVRNFQLPRLPPPAQATATAAGAVLAACPAAAASAAAAGENAVSSAASAAGQTGAFEAQLNPGVLVVCLIAAAPVCYHHLSAPRQPHTAADRLTLSCRNHACIEPIMPDWTMFGC